ncbi:MAG TPA: DUF1501 domain-containing protein, partial [Planctomycetaceae bacterium]|nr:DUF1501 domain-containing protein [Planctomycetaceae bacterium]
MPKPAHPFIQLSRRELLERGGTGLGMLGLAAVLDQAGELGAAPAPDAAPLRDRSTHPLAPRPPHFPAKATRVVHLFMNGG